MRLRTPATVTLIVIATASLAIACSVPVFRYALEHWRPDPYVAFVFHDGDLTPQQQTIAESMQTKSADGSPAANVVVKVVDVSADTDPSTQKIRQEHPSDKLPWMVIQSPPKRGPSQTIWQGELTADNAAMVMDSPARTQVSKRLVDGESVVWILLECGQKEQDDAAFDVLTEELKTLQTKLKLPEIEDEDLGDLSVNPDALRIAFSAVRVSRDDPKERALVEMLVRVEPDLQDEEIRAQPMAFPVFGRGRALYALVGKGIAPDVIAEASEFLTGACQCTVKAQNPGVDLIMNVNWDKLVIPTEPLDEDLPPLAGFSGFGLPDDEVADAVNEPNAVLTQAEKPAESGSDVNTTPAGVANFEPAESGTVGRMQSAESFGVGNTKPADPVTGKTSDQPVDDVSTATTVDSHDDAADASVGMKQNVLYVLGFLVVGVVIATLYFRPRSV